MHQNTSNYNNYQLHPFWATKKTEKWSQKQGKLHLNKPEPDNIIRRPNKGSTFEFSVTSIWALPVRGGGLNPCPNVLGHFLEKNFPSSNGHFLDFGGV